MFGLGKPRTKAGRYLDRNKLTQEKVRTAADIDRVTMAELCGNEDYNPHVKTRIKLIGALRKMGYDVSMEDFW
jgi:putative transcriptional regulator